MEQTMDGSSGTSAYVDSSVGTLVWVRRRNGSWWPGRILGPEELPGSHLLSPRSGTPVKLLGREDASVDWYNIEKSKRVKAFRCGEFDDCIERVRAIASLLTKKREKYARREDAILHALELERKQAESRGISVDEDPEEPLDFENDPVLEDDIDRVGHQSHFGSDFIEPESAADFTQTILTIPKASQGTLSGLFSSQRNKKFLDSEWEDDITEAIPRMRGLQDFGLRIASSKGRRANWSGGCESVSKVPLIEDESKIASCLTKSVTTCPAPNSTKASCASAALKRKRSQAGPSADETAYKRRDRRRPLTQVLESSAKLADGAFPDFEPGSKDSVPRFNPSSENSYIMMHTNQERRALLSEEPYQGSADMESPSGRKGFDLQPTSQISYKPKQEIFDAMDKACSSFSNHLKTNCCDGREPLYVGSQMDVTPLAGSAFVDSLLRGGPASTCSFLSGSVHTGSATSVNDTGFDKSSSISVAENLHPSSSFQVWPNYAGRETLADKSVNDFGLLGRTVDRVTWVPECLSNPPEGVIPSNTMPFYSHRTDLEDHRSKRCSEDLESSLLLPRSDINTDLVKASKRLSRQGLSAVLARSRGRLTGEDEAESFHAIPASCICNADAVGTDPTKQDCCIEGKSNDSEVHASVKLENGFPSIMSQGGLHKLKSGHPLPHGIERSTNEGLDETGFCSFANRGDPSNEGMSMADGRSVSKWQAKGRRNARVLGRATHRQGLAHMEEGNNGLGDEFEQGQEEVDVMLDDVKTYSRHVKLPQPACKRDVHQEVGLLLGGEASWGYEKDLSGTFRESVHYVPKDSDCVRGSFNVGNMQSPEHSWVQRNCSLQSFRCQPHNMIAVQDSTWTDVPIEVRANVQGEHVPLVSLMSKLNGKAIVGHPVIVERLEKRYGDGWSGARKKTTSGSRAKKLPFQPVWRTARRTAMQRVPRSCSSVIPHDCEDTLEILDKQNVQPMSRLGYAGLFNHKNRIMRKSSPAIRHPSLDKRLSKKFSKKLGSSSQKTRMLSSIAVEHTARAETMKPATRRIPEPPVEACIPVNVVFSRLREVLYKEPNCIVPDSRKLSVGAFTSEKQEAA